MSVERLPPPLFRESAELLRVAVCRPAFFELRQPINVIQTAHLERGAAIAADLATNQHADLVAALHAAGAEVVAVAPDPRFPYQLNARDAGLGTPHGLVLGRFRLPIRQGEEELARLAVAATGTPVHGAVQGGAFEGGDLVALGERQAAVGLGPRTQPSAVPELGALLGPDVELVTVPFDDRYLHLDMIFNVVAENLALACLAALPPRFVARLRRDGVRLLEVSEVEVFRHGCNVLAVGRDRIISHTDNDRVNELLRTEGLEVITVDVSELAKSGGGPRCLTLPLERAV